MPMVPLYNVSGEQIGEIELNESVFGIDVHQSVLHDAVVAYLANQRQGTHDTKTRGEVRGGGRKPWRQKGTGRARAGSSRSPIWKGGGIVFGPHPRDYSIKLPKRVRRLAIKSALSSKVESGNIIVLDQLSLEIPKTKEMIRILDNIKASGSKALLVTAAVDENVVKSARNIDGVKSTTASFLNVYDIMAHQTLVITRDAVTKVEEVLAN
ncbi:MAG: 50S ribosomal protein L4 [Peptococcaceae bacterium]|nr:50S ribosomal protein L4 [Peptococcaceae bacterium]